jgi:predicted DCC family thiol-disulfide oxidoreductase YuxK
VARGLRFPWSLAYGLIVVPRPLRDWVYDIVARNRYAWFGKRDACMVPTPDLRARFLGE